MYLDLPNISVGSTFTIDYNKDLKNLDNVIDYQLPGTSNSGTIYGVRNPFQLNTTSILADYCTPTLIPLVAQTLYDLVIITALIPIDHNQFRHHRRGLQRIL